MAAPTQDVGSPDLLWLSANGQLSQEWWETTADLLWPQSVTTFGRMRHDPQLKAVLNAYCLPLLRATWAVDPAGCRDEVVQHTADDLGLPVLNSGDDPGPARRRGITWHRHLRKALLFLVFGHMPFELRYREEKGLLRLDHLGERMPWTLAEINLNDDATIKEVVQATQDRPLTADRLLWYVNEQEGANWAGFSVLRPAYAAWLIKHEVWRVHATSIRRFGMGVPYVEGPPGATAAQVAQARELAQAMRAGDQAGAGIPAGFKPMLMGLQGSVPDALAFIEYLDRAMAKMALAQLIELGSTQTGSRALGESFLDLFLLSLQGVADEMAETATSGQDGMPGAVTDLVDQNWGEDEAAPRIRCLDVGENYQVTAEALAALVTAKALVPDKALEAWIREQWRLPENEGTPAPGAAPPPPAPTRAPPPPGRAGPQGGPGGTPPAPAPPAGTKPGGPVAAPAGPAPGGQATAPGAGKPAASAATPLRRALSAQEVAAGFDAAAYQAEWQGELDALLAQYRTVTAAQYVALADQVQAAAEAQNPAALGQLTAPEGDGAPLIKAAMLAAMVSAARRMTREAAGQGVTIDPAKVRIDEGQIGREAAARAALLGSYLAQQAGTKAMQVVGASPQAAVSEVTAHLDGLGDGALRDHLGAALTAAQNTGRVAALKAAPAAAGRAVYIASEVLDGNTCVPCREIDGTELAGLAEAEAAYPAGAYARCLGQFRCRGTVIATWAQGRAAASGGPPKAGGRQ
jgi:hypothetical protein